MGGKPKAKRKSKIASGSTDGFALAFKADALGRGGTASEPGGEPIGAPSEPLLGGLALRAASSSVSLFSIS